MPRASLYVSNTIIPGMIFQKKHRHSDTHGHLRSSTSDRLVILALHHGTVS
jgi:hypothetical protein